MRRFLFLAVISLLVVSSSAFLLSKSTKARDSGYWSIDLAQCINCGACVPIALTSSCEEAIFEFDNKAHFKSGWDEDNECRCNAGLLDWDSMVEAAAACQIDGCIKFN
jgi:hypothetical protein